MKIAELLQEAKDDDYVHDITITKSDDGKFIVNAPTAKAGMTLDAIYNVYTAFLNRKTGKPQKGVTLKSKAGLTLDWDRIAKNRPNGFVLQFADPEGAQEKVEAAVKNAKATAEKDVKAKAKHKAEAPARRKEASKMDAVYRKADKEERDKKYGKGTWERITYKQEGGDDGYQYVLRLDGRAVMNGLTRYSAEGEKRMLAAELAKQDGLGEYANKE